MEEREDYEPHIRRGLVVWAGVDYQAIVAEAQKEASVIIWDGGNNDFSFLRSDLEIVVVDPMRPGHELAYHPGEMNLRRADIAVRQQGEQRIPARRRRVMANIREVNPRAVVVMTDTVISCLRYRADQGQEGSWWSRTVPRSPTGAWRPGPEWRRRGSSRPTEVVNPRPYAQGELAETYATYPHLGPDPASAWATTRSNCAALEATINAVPADVVVSATPFSLGSLLNLNKPLVQITYELAERGEPRLSDLVRSFLWKQGLAGLRHAGAVSRLRRSGVRAVGQHGASRRRHRWPSHCPICRTTRSLWRRT